MRGTPPSPISVLPTSKPGSPPAVLVGVASMLRHISLWSTTTVTSLFWIYLCFELTELVLAEQRMLLDHEKQTQIENLKKSFMKDREEAIKETKKKQWVTSFLSFKHWTVEIEDGLTCLSARAFSSFWIRDGPFFSYGFLNSNNVWIGSDPPILQFEHNDQ